MDNINGQDLKDELNMLIKTLALMCITSDRIIDQPLAIQARLLKTIGFSNTVIAELLNSTPNSIGVRLSETKSWRECIKPSDKID